MTAVAALVLAAGASRRFGDIKLLADIGGRPLLTHTLSTAEAVLPGHVHLVLGAHLDALLPHTGNARLIINHHWHKGLSSSIAAGVTVVADQYDHVLVLLADQPAITAGQLAALMDRHLSDSPAGMTCARYGDVLGIPAVFSRRWFPALLALEGDKGARHLLRHAGGEVATLDMPTAAIDIDRPGDLANLGPSGEP